MGVDENVDVVSSRGEIRKCEKDEENRRVEVATLREVADKEGPSVKVPGSRR